MSSSKEWEKALKTAEQRAEVFDVGRALSSVGGDREFLIELIGITKAAWPTLLEDLRKGMVRGDLHSVEVTARLAKAAARNVAAKRAYESAQQLQAMAHNGEFGAAQQAMTSLEREVELLRLFLTMAEECK